MKKLSQILAVGVITLAPFVASNGAFAASTCDIGFTGPDSNNQCISVTTFECTIVNETTVSIDNENVQVAVSGDADSNSNTTGGSSSSGSATNSNGTTFNVTVTNAPDTESVCSVVASVPVTVTPDTVVQPVAAPSGRGAAGGVSSLPNTSGDSTMTFVAELIGALGVGAVLSRLAVVGYSRIKS